MKVGSSVIIVPGLYVSSPMKSNDGYLAFSRVATKVSTVLSVSVTISAAASHKVSKIDSMGSMFTVLFFLDVLSNDDGSAARMI